MSTEPGTTPAPAPVPGPPHSPASAPASKPASAPEHGSRIHGCLLGGALGDSLGYAVEFDDISAIRARFGPAGLQDFSALGPGSHFSDDTQMTLYTADGLLEALEWANDGVAADINACVWLAYLRWLGTQGVAVPPSAPVQPPRWIDGQDVLKNRRAPGNACLSGLATGEMGTVYRPVNPDSKGCGTVMRSAPFGLIPHLAPETVYKLSADAASLTHGHPAARQSAGVFSLVIHALASGLGPREAAESALGHLRGGVLRKGEDPDPDVMARLESALRLAGDRLSSEALVSELGEGWVAEEALAVALYAVLATAPGTGTETGTTAADAAEAHFRAAIAVAVNHSGDSDSTASIAGNILGAYYGEQCLPAGWLAALEAPEVIRGMASRLAAVTGV
ncbi:ADP-ribosylglycohydrolase family protein [Arthrobacter sp. ov118]|uniref:ADP-ribosylglycohydrolase family protein n=1 Tax=Arthrobacter sp. ov118 TaxID=1761747 RepID=UPI0008E2A0F8|nr:ADP-ribosylglycohydrolase family protein [Arthrobacter sp. ov118]SFU14266.1 ADP-ribosylglycohydrolase [Arthrobacter sp. ov118]